MPRMVEVVIDSVRVSLTNQQRIVVLREVDTERYLPIWIGPFEAEAITIALQEIEVARPQTHDLLKNAFSLLNARLMRVEVISLRDDVFYGNLVVDNNGRTIEIDSRPSDALALAVRARVPILVSSEVMDSAGIVPEQEAQGPVSIKFQVTAMLFLLFDLEVIFLYPWAAAFGRMGLFALFEMLVFIAVLVVGYVYVWKRGAFEWEV